MENLWQDLPLRAACLFSQSANLTCDRQAALRSSFFYKGREEEELTVGAGLGRARNGLFVAEGFSADRAALAPSP